MREELDKPSPDAAIACLTARQHGVIRTDQLIATGLDKSGITRRVRAHRLHRLHRGVYSIVHPSLLKREGHWLAAVYAGGPGAALSHRSAAALWGVRPQNGGPIEITVPSTTGRAARDGLRIHRSTSLDPADVTLKAGIPVTTPQRTIADLRHQIPADQIRAAIRRAETLRLDIGPQPEYEPDLTRSELERRLLDVCRRHGLPMPEVNVRVGPYWVDFLWRDRGLIVETDGFEHHGTRTAFEADRERALELRLLGFETQRVTHRQVRDTKLLAAKLKALLEATA